MTIIFFIAFAGFSAFAQIVSLDYATYSGTTSSGISQFLGISFAQSPIGDLRFRHPLPPLSVPGPGKVIQASTFGPSCIPAFGLSPGFSEDCLYLNVYAPADGIGQPSKYPVIVWVYGGSFIFGSANSPTYNGNNFINGLPSSQKAIVVTFNYRVGIFGFLSSPDLQADNSLNAGLLDQVAAFQWVQKYISLFGGDPTRVTAWGESAGAHSISYHLVANKYNLFSRAILESGAVHLQARLVTDFPQYYNQITSKLGCPATNALSCIRSKSSQQLVTAASGITYFIPVVDGNYLTQAPFLVAAAGLAQQVPVLWMSNTDEGSVFAQSGNANASPSAATAFERSTIHFLNSTAFAKMQSIYSPSSYNAVGQYQNYFEAASDAYGDFQYKCPIYISILAALNANPSVPLYFGRYNIIPSSNPDLGVAHAAEIPYVWNTVPSPVSTKLLIAYSNFIYGLPVDSGNFGFLWPKFNDNQERFVINAGPIGYMETISNAFIDRCEFWNSASSWFDARAPLTVTTTDMVSSTTTSTATSIPATTTSAASTLSAPMGPVQLASFTYQYSVLSGLIEIQNLAYAKIVSVFYKDSVLGWSSSNKIQASYVGPSNFEGYELWQFSGVSSTIEAFYLRYQVSGQVYYDNNHSQNYST